MEMAQRQYAKEGPKITETTIPDKYKEYADVFKKKASERLPDHKPWDHAINLKPDFEPKKFKEYQLSPWEETLMNEFIDENLHKEYIRPSNSPMASPFFFVRPRK